jgi:hypothetical protein
MLSGRCLVKLYPIWLDCGFARLSPLNSLSLFGYLLIYPIEPLIQTEFFAC